MQGRILLVSLYNRYIGYAIQADSFNIVIDKQDFKP
jgi:hypothetical protein